MSRLEKTLPYTLIKNAAMTVEIFFDNNLLQFVVLFLLAIVLSVLLRYTDYDYPFGIFKLFLQKLTANMCSSIFIKWTYPNSPNSTL